MAENVSNPNDIRALIEQVATTFGVDLSQYGAASPTKVFIEALITATKVIDSSTLIAITEQNPNTVSTLRAKLGLAQLCNLNVVDLLQASLGTVIIDPGSSQLLVQNKTQVLSSDNIQYTVFMEHDSLLLDEPTELTVKQGKLVTKTFIATGELYEAFQLDVEDLLDAESVSVIIDGNKKTVGRSILDGKDFYLIINSDGIPELVANKVLDTDSSIQVTYIDCLGYLGDNAITGYAFTSTDIKDNNPNNLDYTIKIAKPIIGGVSKLELSSKISSEIEGASISNLVGNEAQYMQYLKRYYRYLFQVANKEHNLIYIAVCRNLNALASQYGYWTAAKYVEMGTTAQDIAEFDALVMQLQRLGSQDMDLLTRFIPAKIEYVGVQVEVNMKVPDFNAISNAVSAYAIKYQENRLYELADLYTAINETPNVLECKCTFLDGNINEFNNAVPSDSEHIIIIDRLIMKVNGLSKTVNIDTFEYPLNQTIQS